MSGGGVSSGSSSGGPEKEKDSHWYFSSEQLSNSPSRRQGIDADTELSYRQMTAYLIQEMGQRLQVSQLCINTAIVYMHRFYAFHSFTHFHRNNIAAASLFLAAKVEEQPRKLEHVIKAANKCLSQPTSSTTDAYYIEQAQELVFNENVLLQTLGFDVAIDHPHTFVVKTCHLVKACKDLAQTSYFLASNSLHLTSMCLQYKPTVVACFCIYLACKWSRWEIPQSTEGKHWFHYVDKTVTMDLLKQLTDEFIAIYEKSPSRLKSKLNSIKALAQNASNRVINKEKKGQHEEWKMGDMMKMYAHDGGGSSGSNSNQTYGSTSLGIEPSQQSMSSLLPPPPPQPQLPRKSELHSSQHRSHHNSSSHHSKINFPSTDVLDHKNSHKQPFSGVVGRQRDHSQSSQGHQQSIISANSSRSSLSTSGSRSLSNIPGQNLTRQTAQGHQLDVNYHKSREKSNIMGSYPHTAVNQPHPGYKAAQKSDSTSTRTLQKDPSAVKLAETTKNTNSSSGNNNKLFPPNSSLVSMPQYGNNTSQPQNKLDMGQDLSRNLMHGQRGYGVNNSAGGVPLLGSYQPQHARQSSNSGNNTNKHDISKPTSVHHQQHGKQTSIPPETTYTTGTHDPHQQVTLNPQVHSSAGHLNVRPQETLHNEENTSTQMSSVHGMLQQPTNITQSKTSIFSPDWSEKMQHQSQQLPGGTFANNLPPSSVGDGYNFKFPSYKEGERDKSDRERVDGNATALKKERNRGAHPGIDGTAPIMMGIRPNAAQPQLHLALQKQQALKITMPKKIDSGNTGDLSGLTSGIKRPNEGVYKQEEEQNKIRKLDTQSALSSYSDIKPAETNKLHVVNGIETDPDLVRSLLKESLCPPNALLKTEQLGAPSLQPPAELFEPSAMYVPTTAAETSLKPFTLNVGNEPTPIETTESSGSKTEKKKKKDKHKHKEKDKSKDREERKKHKKDKDKHKERDRGEMDSTEHVKIKISKDKIEGSGESLKIKIPKDRIINDMSSSSGNATADMGIIMHPAPALKIKISKDKLENYATESSSHLSSQQLHALAQPTTGFYSSFVTPNNTSNTTSHSSSGSSGSGKKKDRDRDKDREREKEKKRASNENVKSNGGGSFHSAITLQGVAGGPLLTHLPPTPTVPPKSQNPNKF
ncbi:cyclin-T isoform X2 [Eurosta solidaginis]|uniref:cyclin-T isoform X2 n=1 Tax=Eurosta solidaginis TaxID=178769 RepID=UPI0035316074